MTESTAPMTAEERETDNQLIVEALVATAAQARAEGYAAGMEAAAGIADEYADRASKQAQESDARGEMLLGRPQIEALAIAAAIRARAAEGAKAEKDDGWRPATEGMEWDKVPGRVQVWLEGSAFHSGHEWRRSIWGECRHKGFQWQAEDVERLRLIGDMEIYQVTHWRPYQGVPWPPGLAPHREPVEPEEADHD